MKHTVSERALTLVEQQLKKLDGTVTPQDAAAATGLTVMEAQDALTRLMELYVTRVGYNDQGRILFTFDLPLREQNGLLTAAGFAPVFRESPLEGQELAMVRRALERSDGNIQRAAETLGLSRAALYRRLEKFGIRAE